MRATLLGAVAATLLLAAAADAALPKTGNWKGALSTGEFVHLKVSKKGTKRFVRLKKYQDRSATSGCAVVAVGGFLGETGSALRVRRGGRFRGSFGSFISPLGRRSVVVDSGRFSSSRKGRVRITASDDGAGQGSGCQKTTSFTIRKR